MGFCITVVCEKKNDKGEWENAYFEGFDINSSYVYSWLGGVKNRSMVGPVAADRGFPDDANKQLKRDYAEHFSTFGYSWVLMEELLAIDYDQIVEDRRCLEDGRLGMGGAHTCEEGKGLKISLREFLGEEFMDDLERAKKEGVGRLVFWFD